MHPVTQAPLPYVSTTQLNIFSHDETAANRLRSVNESQVRNISGSLCRANGNGLVSGTRRRLSGLLMRLAESRAYPQAP
jgi:hypothetical protein